MKSEKPFVPWGFNYDRHHDGRLIEDYWEDEWETVERHFRDMKALGANVVRVHLQFGRFMRSAEEPNPQALDRLELLIGLAEELGLYLNVTGLGCYHKDEVPAWYDAMDGAQRWASQERFWEAVAQRGAGRPAVFCYNLMNEPMVPGHRVAEGWLPGEPLGDKHYVQLISRDLAGRPREQVALQWIERLTSAIRRHDEHALITVGLVHWSLPRPRTLYSGFDPKVVGGPLDFIAVHLYPETGKLDQAMELLKGFDIGKPIVIEETFPLRCSPAEHAEFLDRSVRIAHGWFGFYWGRTLEESRAGRTITDAIMAAWLTRFLQGPPEP